MKTRLAVISTKNPDSNILMWNILNLKKIYDEFDIVIIDSDSNDKSGFEMVPDDCVIEYCQNKNWELGAWKFAFNKYNNYDVYMFLQDSLIPMERIPNLDKTSYDKGTIYTLDYHAMLSDGGHFEELIEIYKGSSLHFISELKPDFKITGAAHSFFIINKENVNDILMLEDVYVEKGLKKSKIDSWLAERTCGIMADKQKKRENVGTYFFKTMGHRDYPL